MKKFAERTRVVLSLSFYEIVDFEDALAFLFWFRTHFLDGDAVVDGLGFFRWVFLHEIHGILEFWK
jgi:hypothetical protein